MFNRFVEVGRVIRINYGPDSGKLAIIVEVFDHNRVIIDGPTTGVARQALAIRRLSLTGLKVTIPRGAGSKVVRKVVEKEDVISKWKETTTAKKIASHEARKSMCDFDRFKEMVLNKKKRAIIRKEFSKLKESTPISQ